MSTEPNKVDQHKALHRRVIEELWHRGNVDVLDEHIHPRLKGRQQAEGMGLEDAKRVVRELREAFPDLRVTIDHQVGEGDELATFSTFRGTHRGDFRGIKSTGNSIQVSSACHTRFLEGKVIEESVTFDENSMLNQIRNA